MHAKIEKSHNVTTTTTTTIRNFRTKSTSRSRWRQQLCQTTTEAKVQIWIEIPAPALFNRMAYAEQQRWITVQEKTFTKWLNTKIEVRNLEVQDLVRDLGDGVCFFFPPLRVTICRVFWTSKHVANLPIP